MKTTIDLPAEIVRELKLQSIQQGRKMQDMILEVLSTKEACDGIEATVSMPDFAARTRAIWAEQPKGDSLSKAILGKREPAPSSASLYEMSHDLFENMESDAPSDLSTNPRHFEDFGQ